MEQGILVYLDFNDALLLAGRLWCRIRKGHESATFEYDRAWLEHPNRFSLEPALTLGPGPHHTQSGKALFGSIGDSAPDRWGRLLMRRAERRRAQREGQTPRTLLEIDFLLMVDDESRQGALRFAKTDGGPFLQEGAGRRIPPLIELPRLLSASDHVGEESETDEDLRLLLATGSSLGGARPKASVRDRSSQLAIAKFPHKTDQTNVVLWEALALKLAAKAGIAVPEWNIESVSKKPILISRRFDRIKAGRIPFLSAMSMLGASDRETHSYLEIADALRKYGASPAADLKQLWRRMVFNVLISNTDDHLRNHGFLYDGVSGWRLSPAYDLNPVPAEIKPRILSTLIDSYDGTASLELLFSVAEYFGILKDEAHAMAAEVGASVSKWQREATALGIGTEEIEQMASAFEHDDLKAANRAAGVARNRGGHRKRKK